MKTQHRATISGPTEEEQLWNKIQALATSGVVKEVTEKPNFILTFGVLKKNGSIRIVHDFRELNSMV